MIKIESGIPLAGKAWSAKYPWRDLEVDQSFFVADGKLTALRPAASLAGKRLSRRFVARAVDGGVRCWRVA